MIKNFTATGQQFVFIRDIPQQPSLVLSPPTLPRTEDATPAQIAEAVALKAKGYSATDILADGALPRAVLHIDVGFKFTELLEVEPPRALLLRDILSRFDLGDFVKEGITVTNLLKMGATKSNVIDFKTGYSLSQLRQANVALGGVDMLPSSFSQAPSPQALPRLPGGASAGGLRSTANCDRVIAEARATDDKDQRRKLLGNYLYPIVQSVYPDLAGKITGMILAQDFADIVASIHESALDNKIKEAYNVLIAHREACNAMIAARTANSSSSADLSIPLKLLSSRFSLDDFVQEHVGVDELLALGIAVDKLVAYKTLRTGTFAKILKAPPYSKTRKELETMGFSLRAILDGGFKLEGAKWIGVTIQQLFDAGAVREDCEAAGYEDMSLFLPAAAAALRLA